MAATTMTAIVITRHTPRNVSEATFGFPQLLVAYGYTWLHM